MELSFTNKKLEELANNDRKMVKELGSMRATIFRRRLTQLEDATTLEVVRSLPGNYHELKNNRKGQWSCDLDQPYRLVFKTQKDLLPSNSVNQYNWIEITGVEIIEILNYHKER